MQNNPILDIGWEKDIPQYPVRGCLSHYCPFPFGKGFPIPGSEHALLVQADPQDLLHFYEPINGTDRYRASSWTWRFSIDHYLRLYYYLTEQRYGKEKVQIQLTHKDDNRINNYFSRLKADRKPIRITKKALALQKNHSMDEEYLLNYEMSKFSNRAVVNFLFRDLLSGAKTTNISNPLLFDGLIYRNPNYPQTSCAFLLEDYITHEIVTGISLAIEITSVLLLIKNASLRGKAFDAFCDTILHKVVHSPLFFTRNTVARNFFQEIILEIELSEYKWADIHSGPYFTDDEWNNLIERASKHANILNVPLPDLSVIPSCFDSIVEIDDVLTHITELLAKVKEPVNIPEYINDPQYGLALFCHPRHTNVSYFHDLISKNQATVSSGIPRMSGKRLECFNNVYLKIKEATHTYHTYDIHIWNGKKEIKLSIQE